MVSRASSVEITIEHASAAAIVTSANLPATVAALVDTSRKFVVHPHLARVSTSDPLLRGYLERIYTGHRPLATQYPTVSEFADLSAAATVEAATRTLADALSFTMAKKNAKAGILFGFAIRLGGEKRAHGLIKADLDDELRFHFVVAKDGSWALGEVSDILPPPRAEFAKFAIAPQPNGTEPAGIRDITDNEAAAAYFLEAVGLTVPKISGVQAVVATAALDAGYTHDQIHSAIEGVTEPMPVDAFVLEQFPRVTQQRAERLRGSTVRPVADIRPDDKYIRVYKTSKPRFELAVDNTVEVRIEGRVITVTLPEGSDSIQEQARP